MFTTITVNNFAYLCTDDRFCNVRIYDINGEPDVKLVFEGTLCDAGREYRGVTIQSFEPEFETDEHDTKYFVINVAGTR